MKIFNILLYVALLTSTTSVSAKKFNNDYIFIRTAQCHVILSFLESKGGGAVTKQLASDYIIAMQPFTELVDPLRIESLYQAAKDSYLSGMQKRFSSGSIPVDSDNLPTRQLFIDDFKSNDCITPLRKLIEKDAKDLTNTDIDAFLKVILNDLLLGN